MLPRNASVSNSDTPTPVFSNPKDPPACGVILPDKLECSQITKGNGQKILKSIHPPKDQTTSTTSLGGAPCYVPVADDEFGRSGADTYKRFHNFSQSLHSEIETHSIFIYNQAIFKFFKITILYFS